MKNILLILAVLMTGFCSAGNCSEMINMKKIAYIESNNGQNLRSIGTGGKYQITRICLKDYNLFHKQKYTYSEMNNPDKSYNVAYWYFNIRIPQLLKHNGRSITVNNVIICYNAGIKNLLDNRLPPITKKYIDKYNRFGVYFPKATI